MSTSSLSTVKSLRKNSFKITFSPFFTYHKTQISHKNGQVDPIKKDLLMVCTQRKKDNAKSQNILNMSTPYICEGLRPTLLNTSTSSAGWVTLVITFLHTQHSSSPIFLLILLLTTPSSKLFFFLLSLLKAFK
jgi:hypothetical protein